MCICKEITICLRQIYDPSSGKILFPFVPCSHSLVSLWDSLRVFELTQGPSKALNLASGIAFAIAEMQGPHVQFAALGTEDTDKL